jgi:hypothetical protein
VTIDFETSQSLNYQKNFNKLSLVGFSRAHSFSLFAFSLLALGFIPKLGSVQHQLLVVLNMFLGVQTLVWLGLPN